jgi:hypothetical protein
LLDAIHSASNAPVNYFNRPAEVRRPDSSIERYWDGAVAGFNNPVLAGVTEAVANGHSLNDIRILSIGTANVVLPLGRDFKSDFQANQKLFKEPDKPVIKNDLRKLASSILSDPPDSASFIVHTFLKSADAQRENIPFIRLNPMISPVFENGKWNYPSGYRTSMGEFDLLKDLDMDAVEDEEFRLVIGLAQKWLNDEVLNQSIRNDKYHNPYASYGYAKYSEAKKAWLDLEKE